VCRVVDEMDDHVTYRIQRQTRCVHLYIIDSMAFARYHSISVWSVCCPAYTSISVCLYVCFVRRRDWLTVRLRRAALNTRSTNSSPASGDWQKSDFAVKQLHSDVLLPSRRCCPGATSPWLANLHVPLLLLLLKSSRAPSKMTRSYLLI